MYLGYLNELSKMEGGGSQMESFHFIKWGTKKLLIRCINFWSADERVEMVNVDTFYKEAPEDVSKPDTTKGNMVDTFYREAPEHKPDTTEV